MSLVLSFGIIQNLFLTIVRFDNKAVKFALITFSGVIVYFVVTTFLIIKLKLGIKAIIYGLFISQLLVSFFLIYDHITRISIKYLSIEKLKTLTDFGLKSAVSGVLFYIKIGEINL